MSTGQSTSNHRPPNWWHSLTKRLAASPFGSRLLAHVLHHIDRLVLRLSKGRTTLTSLLTGVPVVWLTTIGAESSHPRTVPLLPIMDKEKIILIASNWGGARHPSWYHNLQANPHATLFLNGDTMTYRARQATQAEREKYWSQAIEIYPGWRAYKQRAQNRQIPIIILAPD
ncbi:MAG TPA: nitroreductase family deazaflavin-dependent oxidoreductase [Anaerolineales bacterium]